MSTILVVDDRPKERAKVVELTRLSIPKNSGWKAEGIDPLPSKDDYPAHIVENNVGVLVLDEKLQEQASAATGVAVQYNGHELVKFLRPYFPELPIFVVTAFDQEYELQNAASEVEGIIPRMQFGKDPKTHTARMIRSGQRFSAAMKEDLIKLAELSKKVAVGAASDEDVHQMNGIREKLALAFPTTDLTYAKDLIPKAEKLLETAQDLLEKIALGKKK